MRCPNCERELRPAARGLVELDCCPACRGAWLGPKEMDKVMEWLPDAEAWPEAATADGGDWPHGVRFYDFG